MGYLEIHDRAGARYVPTDRYFTLGRSLANTVVLRGNAVSRMHARICWVGDRMILQDLGSTHGTQVNGRPIRGETVLCDGDQVQMGDAYMVFRENGNGAGRDADVTPPFGMAPLPEMAPALPVAVSAAPAPRLAANMVRCPYCRTPNLRSNSVCYNCGSALLAAPRPRGGAVAPVRQPPPAPAAWLTGFLVAFALLVLCALGVLLGLLLGSVTPVGMV